MKKLGNKGLSLVQALITIALLSGLGVMTINIAEKQTIVQKGVRARADIQNAVDLFVKTLASSETCEDIVNNLGTGNRLQVIGAGGDEDDPANRTPVAADILDSAGKTIFSSAGAADDYSDINIDAIAFGPASSAGSLLQPVDLWVQYTQTGGAAISPGAATKWMKLDNVLTVELGPTAASGIVTSCYTNQDAITAGISEACQSIGGAISGTGATATCDLTAYPSTTAESSVSNNFLDQRFNDLKTWADQNILMFAGGQTMTGNLNAGDIRINGFSANDKDGLNLQSAENLLANPPANICGGGANGIGYVFGNSVTCTSSLNCPSGERMIGVQNKQPVCVPLLGSKTSCNPGEDRTIIVNSAGRIELDCVPLPPIYTYTCSPTGWTGPGAQCAPGPQASLCNSGTPIQGDTPCCESTPTTICAALPALDEYNCNYASGGWSGPTGSCTAETPDCSTTSVVPDGTTACCPSAPNSMKCPSTSTTLYTCNSSTGSWTSGATNCTAPSVDLGYCTTGTASNGDTACCSSSPVGTCPGTSSTRYRCTATSGWTSVGAGACGSSDSLCTSGSATTGQEACCTSAPSASVCPAVVSTLYTCNTSTGTWNPGATGCTGPSLNGGFCTSGSASNGQTACCDSPPATTTCSSPSTTLYSCNKASGTWSPGATGCTGPSVNGGFCTSGSANNGQTACCSSAPSPSTCTAPTGITYTCNGSTGNWSAGGSCTSGLDTGLCSSGTATNNATACCSSPPPASRCPTATVYNPYRCNGNTWVSGAHGCGGTQSGPCTSGSGATNTLACCTSTPSTPCNYSGFQWRCDNGSWNPLGTACTTGTVSQCSSGTIGHGSTICCPAPGATSRCGVRPRVTGGPGGSTSGGGSCLLASPNSCETRNTTFAGSNFCMDRGYSGNGWTVHTDNNCGGSGGSSCFSLGTTCAHPYRTIKCQPKPPLDPGPPIC